MHDTLHDQRIAFVTGLVIDAGATDVVDLGCGAGRVLAALLRQPQFARVTGLDREAAALAVGRGELAGAVASGRLRLLGGDVTVAHAGIVAPQAVTLVEVIEHLPPQRLSAAEGVVFGHYRPATAVVTTPNVEYNPLYGLRPGQRRDPDHRFEWPRARFRAWATGLARRHGYRVHVGGIGDPHPLHGQPTQYALFRR